MVPTLRDLSLLPVPNWYLLGLQLGISADELDVMERNYPRDNDLCKVKMFGAWLRVDTSATYRKLARALVAVGKRNIAKAMCTARGMMVTVLEGPCIYYSVYCAVGPGVECLQPDRNIYDTDCNLHNVHVGTAVNVCMLVC